MHLLWLPTEAATFCLPLSRASCLFLCFEKPKYTGVRMAMSKVHKAQTFLGVIPRSSTPLIQIVLIDDGAGAQTGTAAEQLAADIMEDITQHGNAWCSSAHPLRVHLNPLLATAPCAPPAAPMSS